MRRLEVGNLYQLAARVWLTAAALTLLLPADRRLGLWLPLHMALAGAVSVAISGAMQGFAAALTAAPDPPRALPITQLILIEVGAALVAFGYPTHHRMLVAAGGASFGAGMLLLAYIVARMWRRSINKRHPVPMLAYAGALASIIVGVTIGALIGSNTARGDAWFALREAHMVVNVLGWVTLTIIGTILMLVPTLLRVRIPAWRPLPVIASVIAGVASLALGLGIGLRPLASIGAILLSVGALGVAWLITLVLKVPRRHYVSIAAKHILAGVAWFVGGAVALAVGMLSGRGESPAVMFASLHDTFLATFVAGWILQVLLGAWLYLLPAQRPATPQDRRRLLAGVELGGTAHLIAINGGLLLVALRSLVPQVTAIGAALAGIGAFIVLAKAWLFPQMAKLQAANHRAELLWSSQNAA